MRLANLLNDMNIFGWSYPAGAENDPNAPYNQEDLPETIDCPNCGEIAEWVDDDEFHCPHCGWGDVAM